MLKDAKGKVRDIDLDADGKVTQIEQLTALGLVHFAADSLARFDHDSLLF